MAFTFPLRRADEPLKKTTLTIALIGDPGAGKTTLGMTAQGLHQDWNRGIHRAVQSVRKDGMNPKDFPDFGGFKNAIMDPGFAAFLKQEGFEAQVVDTVGSMAKDFMMPWLMKVNPAASNRDGTFSLKGYGSLGENFLSIINRYEELEQHSIFIAHAKDNGAETIPRYTIKMPGSSSDTIEERADLIGYISTEGGKRFIEFDSTKLHVGKNAPGFPKMEIPDASSPDFGNWLKRMVIEPALEHFSKQSEEALRIVDAVAQYVADIEKADTPGAVTNLVVALQSEESRSIQVQVKSLLGAAMTAKGMVWDKKLGVCIWNAEKQAVLDAETSPGVAPGGSGDPGPEDHGMTKEEVESE